MGEYLFVYGTLLPGQAPPGIAEVVRRLRDAGPATIAGRLHDLGAYPGVVLDAAATARVDGRLFELPDDPRVLASLDAYEGCDAGLFRRARTSASLADGGDTPCWVYVYERDPGPPPGATTALVRAVRRIRWEDIPSDAREAARHCLLDCLGATIAGSREPATEMLVAAVVRGERSSEAGLIARAERASRLTAALANGTAAHALDFDDTHTVMNGHPTAPVLPAALALAESEDASGRRLLEALVVGIELECRLAALLGGGHYAAGFHATGTLGTFGAAAACAHLLGLDEERWRHALGLAGTQAAGLKSGFGTMAKPLHAGRAASAGLLAALLAREGFTANPDVVETAQGFAATHAGRPSPGDVLTRHAGRFLVRDTLFKFHAACYLTHAAIEAAAELRGRLEHDLDAISRIEVRVSPALLDVCAIPAPRTGLEGKFSLRATTAMALLGDDTGDPAVFTDARMADSSGIL